MKGKIRIYLDDQLIDQVENLITDTGLEWIVQRIAASTSQPFKFIGVGTGLDQATGQDTQLSNEVDRVEATVSVDQRVINYTASFTIGSYNFSEFGLFDSIQGGIMFSRYCDGFIIKYKPETSDLRIEYQISI